MSWKDAHKVRAADSVAATIDLLDAALRRTGAVLLAVTGASNVTGEVLPVRPLADLAHRHGARIVVDGAQLVPRRRVDLAADGIDYLAFSGHRLYAPCGSGALIGRADWLDESSPYLAGEGHSICRPNMRSVFATAGSVPTPCCTASATAKARNGPAWGWVPLPRTSTN